jgi:hypothetical protein
MKKLEPNKIQEVLKPVFEAEPQVGLVYLYGSQARGDAGPRSDYDFAVYFDEKDPVRRGEMLFALAGHISKALKTDAVDVHSLNDIQNLALKYQIIQEGVLIFEREPYEVLVVPRILNEYFDFRYMLRKYGLTKQ